VFIVLRRLGVARRRSACYSAALLVSLEGATRLVGSVGRGDSSGGSGSLGLSPSRLAQS